MTNDLAEELYAIVTTDGPGESLLTVVEPLMGTSIQCVTGSRLVLALFNKLAEESGRPFKIYKYSNKQEINL